MGSIAYIDNERKDLVKNVDRLALLRVRIMSVSDDGVLVHNCHIRGELPRRNQFRCRRRGRRLSSYYSS